MRMLLIGCLAAVMLAQPYSAASVQIVRGVVVDSSGSVIPGATVTLTTAGGVTLSVVRSQ